MKTRKLWIGVFGLTIVCFMPMGTIGFNQKAAAQTLTSKCQTLYSNFRNHRGPKAFAVSQRGGCGWASRVSGLSASQDAAFRFCQSASKTPCRIVESAF